MDRVKMLKVCISEYTFRAIIALKDVTNETETEETITIVRDALVDNVLNLFDGEEK